MSTEKMTEEDIFVYRLVWYLDHKVIDWLVCDDNMYKVESGTVLKNGTDKMDLYLGIYYNHWAPFLRRSTRTRDTYGEYTLKLNKRRINASKSALKDLWEAIKRHRERENEKNRQALRAAILEEINKATDLLIALKEEA